MIADLARAGPGDHPVSSEMPELIGMCDRIIVLREGRMTAEFAARRGDPGGGAARRDRPTPAPATPGGGRRPTRERAERRARPRRRASSRTASSACSRRWLAVVIPVSIVNPRMLSAANLTALAMDAALLTIVAAGPDAGAHHPQHRPLGRLGDRPRRLRLGADA